MSKQSRTEYSDGSLGIIKMAALGRSFKLGNFYDYANDKVVDGRYSEPSCKPSNQQLPEKNLPSKVHLQVEEITFKGPCSKWTHMKLCHHLQATIMANILQKLHGASNYIHDETDTTQAIRAIRIRLVIKKAFLDIESEQLAEPSTSATHIVSAIKYGAEAFIVFHHYLVDDEVKEDVEKKMDFFVHKMINALLERTQPSDLPETFRTKFYGDLNDRPRECSTFEAFELARRLIKDFESDPDRAVPIRVWLRPLDKTAMISELDPDILDSCRRCFDDLIRIKSAAQTLIDRNDERKQLSNLRASLRLFVEYIRRYVELFQSEFRFQLLSIRSGESDHVPIKKSLDIVTNGHFNRDKLETWLKGKKNQMETLRIVSNLTGPKVPFVMSKEKLDSILFSSKWTVVLILPTIDGHTDALLNSMKNYVDHNVRIVRICQDLVNEETSWLDSEALRQDLFTLAVQMSEQAVRDDGQVTFITTSTLTCPSPYYPTLTLFKKGILVKNNFHLPVQPENVRLRRSSSAHPGVNLEWDCCQLEDILYFLVEYRNIRNSSSWISSITSGPINSIKLKMVRDASAFQFRVAAVSIIGQGEFSPLFQVQSMEEGGLFSIDNKPQASLEMMDVVHRRLNDTDVLQLCLEEQIKEMKVEFQDFKVNISRNIEEHSEQISELFESTCKDIDFLKSQFSDSSASFRESVDNQTKEIVLFRETNNHDIKRLETRIQDFKTTMETFVMAQKKAIVLAFNCYNSYHSTVPGNFLVYDNHQESCEDIHGTFNMKMGIFTVMTSGVYHILFNLKSSAAQVSPGSAQLRINSINKFAAIADDSKTLVISALQNLVTGDQLGIYVEQKYFCESSKFKGFLLAH